MSEMERSLVRFAFALLAYISLFRIDIIIKRKKKIRITYIYLFLDVAQLTCLTSDAVNFFMVSFRLAVIKSEVV